jgi:hypothetical protein
MFRCWRKTFKTAPRDGHFKAKNYFQRWLSDESAYPALTVLGVFICMAGAFGLQYLVSNRNIKASEASKSKEFHDTFEEYDNKVRWRNE